MSKLDEKYLTLFKFFKNSFGFPGFLKELLFPNRKKVFNSDINASNQLKGSFQPFADMAKDLVDTFTPYRSWWYVERDALQPIYGIGNLLKGIAYLVAVVPLFIGFIGGLILSLIFTALRSDGLKDFASGFGGGAGFISYISLSWLIDGLGSIVRGATQIATTPLTYLVKMPIRGLITAYYYFNPDPEKRNFLLAENKPSIQALVAEAAELNKKMGKGVACNNRMDEIHRKYNKDSKRVGDSIFADATENKLYLEMQKENSAVRCTKYLAFFQPNTDVAKQKGSDVEKRKKIEVTSKELKYQNTTHTVIT